MTNVNQFNRDGQHGAALIIIVFILAIALTSYVLKEMNAQSIQVDHQQLVRKNLDIAKEALIAWAVANKEFPGQMPYPDRGTDAGGYDGKSDCSGSNPINNQSLLIGQLPMYGSSGCESFSVTEGLAAEVDDGYGNRLWYAVSPNLMHNYAPTGTQLSDPEINSETMNLATWLRVLDSDGNLVSDRVAVVIIAPGEALGDQSRSINATSDQYLDTLQKNGNTYSNSNYDDPNEDFIMATPMNNVSDEDTSYTRPYLFNDQLVYITIDELMVALEKRVAREVVARLRFYFNNNGYFPYASRDSLNNSCQPADGFEYGLLPLNPCPTGDLMLPDWFEYNGWDGLLFYAVSSNCTQGSACAAGTLSVGVIENVNALVVSTGAALSGQSRAVLNLAGYMDSLENTDADLVFDAVGTPLTNIYNDQIFIVAP
ncbi:MAG: hypothetical protein ACSHWN_05870 [Methylophilaceae bacterium]